MTTRVEDYNKFYSQFFNFHLFRDYYYFQRNNGKLNIKTLDINEEEIDIFSEEACNEIIRNAVNKYLNNPSLELYGLLAYSLSFFNDPIHYSIHDDSYRYVDRLLFNFDCIVSDRLKDLIGRINSILSSSYRENKNLLLKKYRMEVNEILKESYPLDDCLWEANKVFTYFESLGLKPLMLYTGGRGFHINLFFDGLHLHHIKEINQYITNKLIDKFNLITLNNNHDTGIFRLQRIPYSVDQFTNLRCIPINNTTSTNKIINEAYTKKRNVSLIDFRFDDYKIDNPKYIDFLTRKDSQFSQMASMRKWNH